MHWQHNRGDAFAYLCLKREIQAGEVKTTVALLPTQVRGHQINLDFDAEDRLVGIEFMDAMDALPPEVLDPDTLYPEK